MVICDVFVAEGASLFRPTALTLHQQALEQGIGTAPGPIFSAKREFGGCIRLNFGHPDLPRQEAVAALGRLATT